MITANEIPTGAKCHYCGQPLVDLRLDCQCYDDRGKAMLEGLDGQLVEVEGPVARFYRVPVEAVTDDTSDHIYPMTFLAYQTSIGELQAAMKKAKNPPKDTPLPELSVDVPSVDGRYILSVSVNGSGSVLIETRPPRGTHEAMARRTHGELEAMSAGPQP